MFKVSTVLIIGVFIITGCSSINKAKLSSENPNDAIVEVQSSLTHYQSDCEVEFLKNCCSRSHRFYREKR